MLVLDKCVFDLSLAHSLKSTRDLNPVDLLTLLAAMLFSRLSVRW